ncbi:oligopeptidase A [Thiolapillus brandeum]|uniref:oligopeptidase A n=1 Tax=Thiolapillus brandeum TaxID=1076588 RepID=A0A7U6GKN1_9GAMM|nr:oligopeptidase A [Thiolapillus brandeum]BAO45407.1 oligopeptidase A [Thiolapillus brandeum]
MSNPLLDFDALPRFSKIHPSHVEPAVDFLLKDNRERVKTLLDTIGQPDWYNFVEPMEEMEDRLSRAWAPVSHLNAVLNSSELRDAYNACLPKLSDYATEMGQNQALFEAYQAVADNPKDLDDAQRKLLENTLRDFRLSGVDLPVDQKQRFGEIASRLSEVSARFEENLLDATNAWSKSISDASQLSGLPVSAMDLARQTAQERGREGWLLTLEYPSYMPVITYADNRELRREVYEAYATRASDQGPDAGRFDNSEVMEEILALRHEMAGLLGYANYAELSLATKMARSTREVMSFLHDLAKRARKQGERELEELHAYAREHHGVDTLEAWDMAYYSEKLRQQRYSISQEELKPWFPQTRVIPGMFEVIGRVFGVSIRESGKQVDTWHPDVRFYEIHDQDGGLLGEFYFDLYARPNKRGGAWMADAISRMKTRNREQIPVAFMTCNFTPPVGGKPALLTHDEVQTLFHEFGHGLHHMLTQVDYPSISGISGVAWDAVELPSQFMENWCWDKQALSLISGHHETGEPLPDELYDRMLAARNFQSAMQLLRQLEFSLFDFRIHMDYQPETGGRIYEILQEVRDEVSVVTPPDWNRFAHGFSHIFGGGYAAGYYSYKWAEVLSADAFSLFEEEGVFNDEIGRAFRRNILEKGGSADAMELFVAFRGREPSIQALLRHSGIEQ